MGSQTWGAVTPRVRQKRGAWTRKKLRRQRLALEAERGIVRQQRRRDPVERAFPNLRT